MSEIEYQTDRQRLEAEASPDMLALASAFEVKLNESGWYDWARCRALILTLAQLATRSQSERVSRLEEALKPFADCAEQIGEDEDDEEWAKFRMLIKDYRLARNALNQGADDGR